MEKINISYNRKSTEDKDKQIQSIESQILANRTIAERYHIKIHKEITETKSAKEPYVRTEFEDMLKLIYTGKVDYIVVWKLDRLARNPVDFGSISYILQKRYIKGILTIEKEFKPEDNTLLSYVEFGMANQFIRDLGQNVKRGLSAKVKKGYKPGRTPIGYLNDYNGIKGEKIILTDPERFEKLQALWKYALTGDYSLSELVRIANDKLKLTQRNRFKHKEYISPIKRSTLWRTLTNPFYYGKFLWLNELIQGNHKPMITEEEFNKVQAILNNTGRRRGIKLVNNYNGLIKCGICGYSVIPEPLKYKKIISTGKIKSYKYWRCSHKSLVTQCHERCITEEELEKQIVEILESVQLDEKFVEWGKKWLRYYAEHEIDDRKSRETEINRQLDNIKIKIDNLVQLMISEQNINNCLLSQEEFIEQKNDLMKEKERFLKLSNDLNQNQNELIDEIINKMNFCQDLVLSFKLGNREEKREILRELARTMTLKSKKLDIECNLPFITFNRIKTQTDQNPNWIELNPDNTDKGNEAFQKICLVWSARRGSNSRPSPWQGGALPAELLPLDPPSDEEHYSR